MGGTIEEKIVLGEKLVFGGHNRRDNSFGGRNLFLRGTIEIKILIKTIIK